MDKVEITDVLPVSDGTAQKLAHAAGRMHMTVDELADWAIDASSDQDLPAMPLSNAEQEFLLARSGLTEEQLVRGKITADESTSDGAARQHAQLLASSVTAKEAAERLGIGADAVRHRILKKQLWSTTIAGQHRIPEWQFVWIDNLPPKFREDARSGVHELTEDMHFGVWATRYVPRPARGGKMLFSFSVLDPAGDPVGEPKVIELPVGSWSTLPGVETIVPVIPASASPLSVEGFMTTEQDELRIGHRQVTPRQWLHEGRDPLEVARLLSELDEVW